MEPALYKLLTFHVPNLMSIFLCLGPLSRKIRPGPRLIDPFRNMLASYGEGLLAPRPTPPNWRTTLYRLSAAAYSITHNNNNNNNNNNYYYYYYYEIPSVV
jgi:hypothetical protein